MKSRCCKRGLVSSLRFFWAALVLLLVVVPHGTHALTGLPARNNNDDMSSNTQMKLINKPILIFCHGSGDTGAGAQAWVQSLIPRTVYDEWTWIFPTAQPIPYQLAGGQVSSVWYDRQGGFDPKFPELTDSVQASVQRLMRVIDAELQKDPQLSARRIVIGGFSMGGNIALQTAAHWQARKNAEPLGAVFGLSCYLTQDSHTWTVLQQQNLASQAKPWPPTFGGHGAADDFILPTWGQDTFARLGQATKMDATTAASKMQFQLYPSVQHEMVSWEMADLMKFLKTHVHAQDAATAEKECHSSS